MDSMLVSPITTPPMGAAKQTDGILHSLKASAQLSSAFHNTRMELLRTHAGMRQLVQRCEGVGAAMERCAAAVAALPSSGNSSFTAAAAPAAPSSPYRQLYWSLSQFHTHAAQLLSAASLQAYDAAVADKMARRLALMERGAATFHRGVAAAQRQATDAAVRGSARQLEQLACTRFAPAYEGFLLYTVATLGDVCALWATAAQRSAEEVVWSSGQAAQSPPAAPLHAEQASAAEAKARGRGPRRSSATTLSAAFGAAVQAVEELRDALFTYVRLLHGTLQQFALVWLLLADSLRAFLPAEEFTALSSVTGRVEETESLLSASVVRWQTRQMCYETLLHEHVCLPLSRLESEAKGGFSLKSLLGSGGARKHSGAGHHSSALQMAASLFSGRSSQRSSRTSSLSVDSTSTSAMSSMAVLWDVWLQLGETCGRIATEASEELAKQVRV